MTIEPKAATFGPAMGRRRVSFVSFVRVDYVAGGRPSKCPQRKDFIDLALEYQGDETELATLFGVCVRTVQRWIEKLGVADWMLRARIHTDIKARGIIRRRIFDDDFMAATYWLNRSDRLRELAESKSVGYDQPPRERVLDEYMGRDDVEERSG